MESRLSNTEQQGCTCTQDGYSPDCPQVFSQGGELLHTLRDENRLKPRTYYGLGKEGETIRLPLPSTLPDHGPINTDHNQGEITKERGNPIDPTRLEKSDPFKYQQVESDIERSLEEMCSQPGEQSFVTSHGLKCDQRGSLERFRPLTLGGISLTEAKIGGYQLNLEKTAEKAQEVVPLPPSFLPRIFRDPDLNFNHHFFQGVEKLAGRSFITRIVKAGTYSEKDKGKILPILKELISSGYKDSDTELTVFVKNVLSSTFETQPSRPHESHLDCFTVSANLWGFQYIEQGMQCRESDLKMWLHMAHTNYRMTWFNTFKSSGIPHFAVEGVQERYEGEPTLDPRSKLFDPVVEEHYGRKARQERRKRDRAEEQRREHNAQLRKDGPMSLRKFLTQ